MVCRRLDSIAPFIFIFGLLGLGADISSAQVANGLYAVVDQASGKCVDAAASGTANGTVVQQFACNGTGAQQWQFTATDSGYYKVTTRNNAAQGWDVTGGTAATADGTKVQLWSYGGGTNQQWKPVAVGNGNYSLVARHSQKCLDVPGSSSADGVQLQQWTCNGTGAQSFHLASGSSPTPTATPTRTATPTATTRATARPTSTSTPTPTTPPGSGDVVGKVTVGYQAWFAARGDTSPINAWWHWSQDWSQTPSVAQNVIHAWPDTREYPNLYTTSYPNLGNGQAARLFSSFDQSTINVQMGWMKQYGVDAAALQRFNPTGGEGPIRDAITAKVRNAAESTGVKFYVMYDVTGWTTMQSEIKNDWTTKMSAYASSPAYARQNGKPVVAIWGFGFNDGNHPWDAATCLDVVNWFKGQGVYVIGGVPREWRTGVGGSRPGFLGVYHAFNMISPWMVGAIGTVGQADDHYNNELVPDEADLKANGIAYQPCVLPGDRGQRVHGDFMWRQFYNVVRAGSQAVYISMFDEYNEGNQIAKTAEDPSLSPSGTSNIFFTLDEDGTHCTSDYYLRLTGDGGRMLKGQLALTSVRPTSPQ